MSGMNNLVLPVSINEDDHQESNFEGGKLSNIIELPSTTSSSTAVGDFACSLGVAPLAVNNNYLSNIAGEITATSAPPGISKQAVAAEADNLPKVSSAISMSAPASSSQGCSLYTQYPFSDSITEEDSRIDEIRRFVAPLSKEQLIDLVAQAAINHQEVYMKCTQAVASSPSSRRLMVRNIPFFSRDDAFVGLFQSFGEIDDAVIVREKDGRSRGYGFVTFKYLDSVRKCLVTPTQLDGKELQVKLAADPFTYSDQRKLFVRNLAKSTDSDSLRNVFSQFGTLEECVVISYGHGKSKYGFITYVNASDAFKAIQQSEKIIDGRVVFIHFASPSNSKYKGNMIGGGGGHFNGRGDYGHRNGVGGCGGGALSNFRGGGYVVQANGPYGYTYPRYDAGMYAAGVPQGYHTMPGYDYYSISNHQGNNAGVGRGGGYYGNPNCVGARY